MFRGSHACILLIQAAVPCRLFRSEVIARSCGPTLFIFLALIFIVRRVFYRGHHRLCVFVIVVYPAMRRERRRCDWQHLFGDAGVSLVCRFASNLARVGDISGEESTKGESKGFLKIPCTVCIFLIMRHLIFFPP